MQGPELVNAVISDLEKEAIWEVARFTELKLKSFSMVKVNLPAKVLTILNGLVIKCQIKFRVDKCKAHVKKAILIIPEECQTARRLLALWKENLVTQ